MASRTSPMRTSVPRGGTSSLDSASNSRVQQQQPQGSSGQPQQLRTSSTGGNGNVAIFWDIENCQVPGEVNAEDVAGNIRYALRDHPQIGVVTMFSAYGDFNHFPRKVWEGCQRTGVNLIDVPNGKKNAADKAILADMFLFALDNHPPSTIFLITGDVDFAPALHKLGQRGYMVVLVVPDGVGVFSALRAAANYVWDWPSLCRGGLVHAQKYGQHRATNVSKYEDLNSMSGLQNAYLDMGPGRWGATEYDPQNYDLSFGEEIFPWQPPMNVYTVDSRVSYFSGQTDNFTQQFGSSHVQPQDPRLVQVSQHVNRTPVSAPPSTKVFSRPMFPNPEPAGQIGNLPVQTGEAGTLGDSSNPTSPGHAFQSTWVQPSDLSGLKRQFVKLLHLNGGKMALVCVPVEYNKQFGRPLYLAEYNASKLVNLIEKMKDSLSIKGEGGQKILHLTKPLSHSSQKYSPGLNRGSVPKGEKEKDVSEDSEPEGQGSAVKEVEKDASKAEKGTTEEGLSKHFLLDTDIDYKGGPALLGVDWDSGSGNEKENSSDPLMENGDEVAEKFESSLMQDGFTILEKFFSKSRRNFTDVEVDDDQSCSPPGKGNDHHQQISNYENPCVSRRVSLSESFGSDDYFQEQKQLSMVEAGDTSENCFQIGLPQLENDSILIVGRKGTFEGADAIEFLFEQVEHMSKIVGVGLQRSKVVVTEQFGVMVIQISEQMWLDLWKETSFVPVSTNVPKLPINYKLPTCNLTPEESSKRFGVGLGGFRSEGLCMYVEDNMSKQIGEMLLIIFELAEKMGLKSENAKASWFQHLKDVSLETMEGQVSDQGGSSNEPMDGGDHDQGATSHEPMEGAVSNQGGTLSEHMELGGQVEQQSFGGNPFQLLSESSSGRGPTVSEKNGSLTVIVIPECGGTFHKGLTKELAEPDGRIKSATIAPWLKFKFEKSGDSRKITTTTVTQCNLGGGQLKYHEDLDLGYYHDNITISLTCEENLAARLLSGTVTSIDLTKSSMTETFTGSRSIANQMSGQANVQVQIPLVGVGMQAQGNLGVIDTFGDSRAIAATMESSNTQFAGFLVNPNECPGSLNFNFLYHVEIMEEIAKGRRQFMHAGINKTLWPTIVGEWVPLDTEEARLYKFKTERDITSIGSLRRSTPNGEMPVFMQQRYEVSMFINHAMTHIHCYGTTELREPGVQSLPKVLTKFPAI